MGGSNQAQAATTSTGGKGGSGTVSQGGNVFQQAAGAYGSGLGNIAGSTAENPYVSTGAGLVSGSTTDNPYGLVGANMMASSATPNAATLTAADTLAGGGSPYLGEAASIYGSTVGEPAAVRSMNTYLNPYQTDVIDNMISRMRESRAEDLNMVGSQAAQAGAYGGARQGLVEAELMDRYNRNENEAIKTALQEGFNTSAGLGQNLLGIEQGAAGGLAGLGVTDINRAGMLADLGTTLQGQQQSAAQGLMQYGLGQQGQALGAGQALTGTGQGLMDRLLSAGIAGVNAAPVGVGIGQGVLDQQMSAGAAQQQTMQQILDQATGQYDTYANYPQLALGTALAGISGNPLQAATTTTQRTTPSLFDYMSLGAGMGSSYLGNK